MFAKKEEGCQKYRLLNLFPIHLLTDLSLMQVFLPLYVPQVRGCDHLRLISPPSSQLCSFFYLYLSVIVLEIFPFSRQNFTCFLSPGLARMRKWKFQRERNARKLFYGSLQIQHFQLDPLPTQMVSRPQFKQGACLVQKAFLSLPRRVCTL